MFYERLQRIMDSRQLNVYRVAQICELSDSTVRSIVSRKAKTATLDVAMKIAKGLNVNIEYLNGDTDVVDSYEASKIWIEENVPNATLKEVLECYVNMSLGI